MKTLFVFVILSFSIGANGEDCGGDIYNNSGVIQSPNYPYAYPVNTECIWSFKAVQTAEYVLAFQIEHIQMFYYASSNNTICTASLTIQSNSSSPDGVDCKSSDPSCYTYRSSDVPSCRNVQDANYTECQNGKVEKSNKLEVKFESNNDPGGAYSERRFSMTYEYVPCSDSTPPSTATSSTSSTSTRVSSSTPNPTASSSPVFTPSWTPNATSSSTTIFISSSNPPLNNLVAIVVGSLVIVLILVGISIIVFILQKKRHKANRTDETNLSSESNVVYRPTQRSNEGLNTNSSQTTADDGRNYSKIEENMNQTRIYVNDEPEHSPEGEMNPSFRADSQKDGHLYHRIVPGVSSNGEKVNNESDYVLPETSPNDISKQTDTGYRHDLATGDLRCLQASKPNPVVEYENLKGNEMMPENAYETYESTTLGAPAASGSMPALSQHQLYAPTYEDIPKFKPNLESPYLVANVEKANARDLS